MWWCRRSRHVARHARPRPSARKPRRCPYERQARRSVGEEPPSSTPFADDAGGEPWMKYSSMRAPTLAGLAQSGVRVGLRVKLNNGLAAPRLNRPRCRRRKLPYRVPSAAGRTLAGGQLSRKTTMTNDRMVLLDLIEKSVDADLVRAMLAFAAE